MLHFPLKIGNAGDITLQTLQRYPWVTIPLGIVVSTWPVGQPQVNLSGELHSVQFNKLSVNSDKQYKPLSILEHVA